MNGYSRECEWTRSLTLRAWSKSGLSFAPLYDLKVTGHSATFINYAVWESADHFGKAIGKVMDPQDRMSAYPPSTVTPHLFKKVALQGILCI